MFLMLCSLTLKCSKLPGKVVHKKIVFNSKKDRMCSILVFKRHKKVNCILFYFFEKDLKSFISHRMSNKVRELVTLQTFLYR